MCVRVCVCVHICVHVWASLSSVIEPPCVGCMHAEVGGVAYMYMHIYMSMSMSMYTCVMYATCVRCMQRSLGLAPELRRDSCSE